MLDLNFNSSFVVSRTPPCSRTSRVRKYPARLPRVADIQASPPESRILPRDDVLGFYVITGSAPFFRNFSRRPFLDGRRRTYVTDVCSPGGNYGRTTNFVSRFFGLSVNRHIRIPLCIRPPLPQPTRQWWPTALLRASRDSSRLKAASHVRGITSSVAEKQFKRESNHKVLGLIN